MISSLICVCSFINDNLLFFYILFLLILFLLFMFVFLSFYLYFHHMLSRELKRQSRDKQTRKNDAFLLTIPLTFVRFHGIAAGHLVIMIAAAGTCPNLTSKSRVRDM